MGQFTKHNNDKNSHQQMTYLPRGRSVQRKGDGKGQFTMPTWFQPSIHIAGLHRGVEVRQGSVMCKGGTVVEGTFVIGTIYRLPPMHQAPSRYFAHQASFNSQEKILCRREKFHFSFCSWEEQDSGMQGLTPDHPTSEVCLLPDPTCQTTTRWPFTIPQNLNYFNFSG